MKQNTRNEIYNLWNSEEKEEDFPEVKTIFQIAEDNPDLADKEDDLIGAAADLQRKAWLAGFDYAIRVLMDK